MTQFVVREVEWSGDVDGCGPEIWLGRELGRFDTEDEALDFIDTQWTECEVVEELPYWLTGYRFGCIIHT